MGHLDKLTSALSLAIAATAGVLTPEGVQAHHSFATHYIMDQPMEITGVVSEVSLRNPHSFLMVDVMTEQGIVPWEVEAHAIPLMRRMGFEMDTIQVGDTITVIGPSPRTDKHLTFGGRIILADGTEFQLLGGALGAGLTNALRQDGEVESVDGPVMNRFAGRWGHITGGNGGVGDSPMPLTAAAHAARANYDPRETPAMNCVAPNLPSLFHAPYLLEIRTDAAQPIIYHEYYSVSRPLSLESGAAVTTPLEYGRRTARLEGEGLIVESNGFPAGPAGLASDWDANGQGRNVPGSDRKHVFERYTLREEGRILVLDYTVEDPVYLTEPYSNRTEWQRLRDDTPIYPFDCDVETATRSTLNAAPVESSN